jgi:catechol 2,3-dioxygenase-like lactoylglutathione lyase family enzyme
MPQPLDNIHHLALQVDNIDQSLRWYASNFSCEILYQDESWALLKFGNISLALVLPNQHPPHFAVIRENVESYGLPKKHRDGTSSVYIKDPSGNNIEMLELSALP